MSLPQLVAGVPCQIGALNGRLSTRCSADALVFIAIVARMRRLLDGQDGFFEGSSARAQRELLNWWRHPPPLWGLRIEAATALHRSPLRDFFDQR